VATSEGLVPDNPDSGATSETKQTGDWIQPTVKGDTADEGRGKTIDSAATLPAPPPSAPAIPGAGYRFGDIELIEEVGRGGMGLVYKARQLSLDRIVAVKMLLADHVDNPVSLTRFLGEARAAAALDHPSIVNIFQVGQSGQVHYFVMEYIKGESLDQVVARGPVPIATAVPWVIAVAQAVGYAHSKGVIHRDLKPGNIMLKDLRRPVIMDFGIAKVLGKSPDVTQEGVVVGTPAYMAPEQAEQRGEAPGPATDTYAVGAILYALLTGHAPYEGSTALSTIVRVISPEPPRSPRSWRADIPEALEQICLKCLAKTPRDRYPSARALVNDLNRFRSGQQPAATPAQPQPEPIAMPAMPSRADLEALAKPAPPEPAPASVPTLGLVVKESGKMLRIVRPVTVIGRAKECDLILRSADVSKRHCQLVWKGTQLWIEDLQSANGIFVNKKKVQSSRLYNRDTLDISGHGFEIRLKKSKANDA
jgi:serine/threonine protein kinase